MSSGLGNISGRMELGFGGGEAGELEEEGDVRVEMKGFEYGRRAYDGEVSTRGADISSEQREERIKR